MKAKACGDSAYYGDYILKYQLNNVRPSTVVDFGAGGGKIGRFAKQILSEKVEITAVEGCEGACQIILRDKLYNHVCFSLIQEWIYRDRKNYDLAVFGDVLEHLKPKEIHTVIRKCLNKFRHIIVVCPLYDIFQDEHYGNPLEAHLTYITENFFDEYNIAEKHVIKGRNYTIMNILIISGESVPLYRKIAWNLFHYMVLVLQPLGVAKWWVDFLKRYGKHFKWLLRD